MSQTIEIRQFNAQYNVARSIDHPTTIQRRLDQVVSHLLAQTLEDQLAIFNDNDNALYFIEQVHFDLPLDLTQKDDRQLATIWASAITTSIQRTISQSGTGIVVFPDRHSFVASFIEDLIQGRAWDCWYYSEFADLRSISMGQAILQVLTQDVDVGRDALIEITKRDSLDRLLARLNDTEVTSIGLQCLLPPSPRVSFDSGVWLGAIRNLLKRGSTMLQGTPAHGLLRIYCGLLRQRPELGPDVHLARFIWELLDLRQTVQQMADRSGFLRLLESDNWSVALGQLGAGMGQQLLRNLQRELTGSETVELLRDLQLEAVAMPTQQLRTAFGGIFLLVGAIVDLDLYGFLESCVYPEPDGVPKANLLLWLMALQCLGQENLARSMADRGVLKFAGLKQAPDVEWLAAYGAGLTVEMHETFGVDLVAHCGRVVAERFEYRGVADFGEPGECLRLHGVPGSPLADEVWDNTLGILSSIVLRGFGVRLGALGGSSPGYVSRNFLECGAVVSIGEAEISIGFLVCPLQMVLKMAGFEHFRWPVRWLGDRRLIFDFDG
jgi:hypothetical protein